MSPPLPVIIVGAGIGGLASAISLACQGVPVLVVERASQSGGKIRQEQVSGRYLDAGPTVLTMRWVFDDLFDKAHQSFDSHVRLLRASRLARHFWQGGARLDLFSDLEESIDAIGTFAGSKEAEGYRRFTDHSAKIHTTVRDVFLQSDRPSLASTLAALRRVGLPALWQVEGHRTLWNALGDYFHDPRLRQLFARYATYAGSSPFLSPATLNVIAHVEREGVWLPEGGMRSVADACERVARGLGVVFRYDTEVEKLVIGTHGVEGVRTADGETITSAAVVFNGDPAAVASGLLGDRVRKAASLPKHRSLSAVTICAVAPVRGFDLDYHTVFFSDDYAREFIELFHQMAVPSRPTVYVCAQDRAGFTTTAGPDERLFFLINAPATGDTSATELSSCQTSMLETLRQCGWEPELSAGSVITTPADFATRFPATGGSLYGAASHGMLSPLAKAPARSKIPGLYFAGGGAHPGAGVPMAATSGVLAARAILQDLASTRRSLPTATDGGTSTSSATTAPTPWW
jgi:1-hydroxycarotenoid 3,4-desaturase